MDISWTPNLSVGVEKVDRQHQELFLRVKRLVQAFAEGRQLAELESTLAFLNEYVLVHFAEEESLMEEYPYPGREYHLLEHEIFRARVKDLQESLASTGPQPDLLATIKQSIVGWLVNHVCIEDQAMGQHYIAVNSAAPRSQLP